MPRQPEFEQFQKWAPDQGTFSTGQSEEARNVIRTATGYRPFPGLVDANMSKLPGSDLTVSQPTGLFFGKRVDGQAQSFTAIYEPGNTANSRVWELGTDGRWTTGSPSWPVSSAQRFRTAQWEDTLYITNFDDYLRSRLLASGVDDFTPVLFDTAPTAVWDSGTAYVLDDLVLHTSASITNVWQATDAAPDVGVEPQDNTDDWALQTLDYAVKPKYLAVVRDFLMVAHTEDPAFGTNDGGLHPDRVRWSGINQPSNFSLLGDATTLSDRRDLPDAGEVRGLVGGEYGVVLCENGIFRVDFVGPPNVFAFNRIERARGCLEPNSVVIANNVVYYLSDDGWKMFDGQNVQSFGAERFDRWFRTTATQSILDRMTTFVDPNNQLIIWGFSATKDITDRNDRVLIFNYAINEPTYGYLNHSLLGSYLTPSLDIDTFTSTLVQGLGANDTWQGRWLAPLIQTIDYAVNDIVSYFPTPPAGTTWAGLWEDATSYVIDNVVYLATGDSSKEDTFRCIADHTSAPNTVPRATAPLETGAVTFATVPSPAEATWTGHDLVDNAMVVFDTDDTLPPELMPGVVYWARVIDVNTFSVATASGGAGMDMTLGQAGTHTVRGFAFVDWQTYWEQVRGEGRAYRCTSALTNQTAAVTFTVISDQVEWVAHGLSEDQPIRFYNTGGALPPEITEGQIYYVVDSAGLDAFQISRFPLTGAIALIGTGTGTHAATTASILPPFYDTGNWEYAPEITAPIDNLGKIPWDSTVFKPGAQIFGGISRELDGTDKLHIFSGFPDECVIDTTEFRPNPIGYSLLDKLQLGIEGDDTNVTIEIGSRKRLGDNISWSRVHTIQPDQSYKPRANSRYHRVRCRITGAWRDATGAFHWATPTSEK